MHLPTVSMLFLLLLLPDVAYFQNQLTIPQIAIALAVGALGTTAGVLVGTILPRLGRGRPITETETSCSYGAYGCRRRRRRRAPVSHNINFAKFGISEPEECFRRVFCAPATGK